MTGVADTFAAAAQAASPNVQDDNVRRALTRIMGIEALVCYRLDEAEHERRQQAAAPPVVSADVLDLLLDLPLGAPVPIASLTTGERAAMRMAPRGAISVRGGHVIRLAVAPLSVDLAVVGARNWRSGLEVAGRFAPFCAGAMVLHNRPLNLAEVQMQADFYGVGVIVVTGQTTEVLVEPAVFHRRRFTAAGWRFLEEVYRAVP